jgi:hypothetical protein
LEFVVNEVKENNQIGKAQREAQLELTELMRTVIENLKAKKGQRKA